MNEARKYDVVLPLYHPHEGWDDHIAYAAKHLCEYFADKNCILTFYVTNDGTPLDCYPDEALEKVRKAANGRLNFITYPKNHGKGYSIRFLVSQTEGDKIVYTDGDFPFGWEAVAKAFEKLEEGYDVVMGQRASSYGQALPFVRKILSHGAKCLNRLLLGLPNEFIDTQAGLKGFNQEGKKTFLKTTVDTFVFDTEFILLAWKNKLKIAALPISIRDGIVFSPMGRKIMMRELRLFLRILWNVRIRGKY